MNLLTRVLDTAFRRISPEDLLRKILEADFHCVAADSDPIYTCFKKSFMAMAELTLEGYSYDEQEHVFTYFEQIPGRHSSGKPRAFPPFRLLLDLGKRTFEENREAPICKFNEVLHWREAYLLLGQDIFTTAWLAERYPLAYKPVQFSWPSIIPVHHPTLNRITDHITENHLHLFAGASTFTLSWSCLMNHPETIFDFQDSMGQLLQINSTRQLQGCVWSFSRRMLYAAKIREILFRALSCKGADIVGELCRFHNGFVSEKYSCVELVQQIDTLRFYYGILFEQPGFAPPTCLDYAFTANLAEEVLEPSRLLASERFFLFRCFQKCFSGEFNVAEQWIFFVYLVLKAKFREELIQVNRQTGFHNFRAYDSRKKTIWNRYPAYLNEDIYQAINAAQTEQGIVALEGRICPEKTALENVELIHQIDRSKLFFDDENLAWRWRISEWFPTYAMENLATNEDYFFILHFPKEKDVTKQPDIFFEEKDILERPEYSPAICRHADYRRRLRAVSINLAKALSNYSYFRQRVVGIDACSNEIGCRPEVFAQAFRFLRNFESSFYHAYSSELNRPKLSATYHVGEDFLDIADGLRAMDEAVWFLNLSRGDRFGHALALGVNPRLHYEKKHHQIILPKQDLLDNLVWLYFRSVELRAEVPSNLRHELMNRAEQLFWEIYGKSNCYNSFSMELYYHSMMLRGDAPELYRSGQYRRIPISDPYDSFAKNKNADQRESLRHFRRRSEIVNLYFLYHYDHRAKWIGAQLETMEIKPEYIQLMSSMQRAMQVYLNEIGISIECNPSSNVLIGTFSDYQNHPILNFYSHGLNVPHRDVQMHVSINSDDPGVFDTSLKFEYALIAKAIGDLRDENGKPLHNDREIEDYIVNLVEMGLDQSFCKKRQTT